MLKVGNNKINFRFYFIERKNRLTGTENFIAFGNLAEVMESGFRIFF